MRFFLCFFAMFVSWLMPMCAVVVTPRKPPYIFAESRLYPHRRVSDHPYLSADTLRAACDHHFDEAREPLDTDLVRDGDTIYVMYEHYLDQFFNQVHPHIKAKYILVAAFGDFPLPGDYAYCLEDKQLAFWFLYNFDGTENAKIVPIPCGIPPREIYYPYPVGALDQMIRAAPKIKKHLLYLNFAKNTNPNERYTKNIVLLQHRPYTLHITERKPYPEYLKDMANSEFVLSPPGRGQDCYRTWEALLVDAIPIVKSSTLNSLYEDLRILVVDDFDKLTKEFLIEQKQKLQVKKFNKKKLYADYWLNKIHQCQDLLRAEANNKTE